MQNKVTIPRPLNTKIYKTGQTRGADDSSIYQNRVGRNSTVLIPYSIWNSIKSVQNINYENGYTVLISPSEFARKKIEIQKENKLILGQNMLIFYEKRTDWNIYSPTRYGFLEAQKRINPMGGQYVARIANTTSNNDEKIYKGFTTSGLKGAGIRLYEYADNKTIKYCRDQLEAMFWHAIDAKEQMLAYMSADDIAARKAAAIAKAEKNGLLDYKRLINERILNKKNELVCPLCLEPVSAAGFMTRLPQATGRERHDLTVTEINLFHIKELAYGLFNHTPYNLGWGHHHCNVVCKDAGIDETLSWMNSVIVRNEKHISE